MKKRPQMLLPLLLLLSVALFACGDNTASTQSTTTTASTPGATGSQSAASNTAQIAIPSKITIAYQPGLGYANLVVMKQQKVLETAFPKTTFEWKILSNGAAIRDGMIASQIQLGALGVAPFLVGWDKGANWKMLAGLDELDLWLMTKDANIQSLKDIKAGMKIGMPAPDSIQALVLRKAAQDQLGNAKALDNNIISIDHPLGVQALMNGQLTAHLTTPPFQFQETSAGAHAILHSFDVFGQATSLGLFMTQSFYDKYPDFSKWFYQQLSDATSFIKSKPDQAAQLLSQEDGGKTTAEQYKTWLADKSIVYDTTPHGMVKYANFMKATGMMGKTPATVKDLELAPLNGAGD